MTTTDVRSGQLTNVTLDDRIAAVFDPVLERIAADAVARELDRRLPHAEVRELVDSGFGALRVPEEFGGWGASLEQEFRLLIRLGRRTPTCRNCSAATSPSSRPSGACRRARPDPNGSLGSRRTAFCSATLRPRRGRRPR